MMHAISHMTTLNVAVASASGTLKKTSLEDSLLLLSLI